MEINEVLMPGVHAPAEDKPQIYDATYPNPSAINAVKEVAPEPISPLYPAAFLQADLGFRISRGDWPSHASITGNGSGGYVTETGEPYEPTEEDLNAPWSVK